MTKRRRFPKSPVKQIAGWRHCLRCKRWHDGPFRTTPRNASANLKLWSRAFSAAFPHLLPPGNMLPPERKICLRSFHFSHTSNSPRFDVSLGNGKALDTNPDSTTRQTYLRIQEAKELSKSRQAQQELDSILALEQEIEATKTRCLQQISKLEDKLAKQVKAFYAKHSFDPRSNSQSDSTMSESMEHGSNTVVRAGVLQLDFAGKRTEKAIRTLVGFPGIEELKGFITNVTDHFYATQAHWPHEMPVSVAVELGLMRLRMGRSFTELSMFTRFSKDTVARAIHSILPVMAEVSEKWLTLPSRDQIQLPAGHASLIPGAVLAVDSTYLFTSKPQAYHTQVATWLDHKRRNGVKLMLAVLPSGLIVGYQGPSGSEGEDLLWQRLVQKMNLSQWIRQGDVIVRDRGFNRNIQARDFNQEHSLEVLSPSFKGTNPFTCQEVFENRAVSSWRAVVEQTNARLKSFQLLCRLSQREVQYWEDYIVVAIALTNHCFQPLYATDSGLTEEQRPIVSLSFPNDLPTGGRGADQTLFDPSPAPSFDHQDALPVPLVAETRTSSVVATDHPPASETAAHDQSDAHCSPSVDDISAGVDARTVIERVVTPPISVNSLMALSKQQLSTLCADLQLRRKTGTKGMMLLEAHTTNLPQEKNPFPLLHANVQCSEIAQAITAFVQERLGLSCEITKETLTRLSRLELQQVASGLSETTSGSISELSTRIWARFQSAHQPPVTGRDIASSIGQRPPGWARSAIVCTVQSAPPIPWSRQWRIAIENAASRFCSGTLGADLTPTIANALPPITDDFLRSYFRTPRVSRHTPYSSTFNRSSWFLKGNCHHVSDTMRYCVDERSSAVLVHGTIQPSMAKSPQRKPYQIFALFKFADTSSRSLACHCTCYNGTSSNCSHIVALLRKIGINQGRIKPLISVHDDHFCESVDDSRLASAVQKSQDNASSQHRPHCA